MLHDSPAARIPPATMISSLANAMVHRLGHGPDRLFRHDAFMYRSIRLAWTEAVGKAGKRKKKKKKEKKKKKNK